MRPDRSGEPRPSGLVPFEPLDMTGLSVLEDELAAAGRRIRAESSRAERPDPMFAASLRDRLVGQLPVAERAGPLPSAADPTPLAPERLSPRLVRAAPRFLPAPGWTVATIAAALIVSLVGLGPGHLLQAPAPSRAGDVAGANLVRGSTTVTLATGMPLHPDHGQ